MNKGMLLIPALLLAFATAARAEGKPVTTDGERKDTAELTVGGGVLIHYVHWDGNLVEMILAPGTDYGDLTGVCGRAFVNLDAKLEKNVDVHVELASYITQAGVPVGFYSYNPEITDLYVTEARVSVSEFLDESISMDLGVVPYSFNVHNYGGSMLFNPRWSDSTTSAVSAATNLPRGRGELQPTGLVVHHRRDELTFDLIALPAIAEAGDTDISNDEAAFGGAFALDLSGSEGLNEGSRIAGIVLLSNTVGDADTTTAGLQADGRESAYWTIGGGADLELEGGLSLFGEAYFQVGDAYRNDGEVLDARAYAFQLGVRKELDPEARAWVMGKVTCFSGDDDAGDDEENNFLSYEQIEDLLIVEHQCVGINLRSNYLALKGSGGFTTTALGPAPVTLTGTVAYVRMMEDVVSGTDEENVMGVEVDGIAMFSLNRQTHLILAGGYLTGSDVLEIITADGVDDTWMITLGAMADF